jgi:hypothetical protein
LENFAQIAPLHAVDLLITDDREDVGVEEPVGAGHQVQC